MVSIASLIAFLVHASGAFGKNINPLSVIPGLEPGIHTSAADGWGMDARLKAEHDGEWVSTKTIRPADARVSDAIRWRYQTIHQGPN
ncbi:hypothetical protein [Rhizobium bangladeshense]|uniref:hypothetical protein n=1 Tax=Rhizobium bangladeshense TaxID=1138189 RepID=UPI001C836CE7|nr:hypothetical protein [Rhizobium bangladeshense]MBX4889474.1 hypothetical protein [Rhizobium bangladeshense]MBX4918787.1 hypothetical protein [Rhizobium bangladeshense]MBY3599648.1 hypothetical protein [Rhizobium bangladeshense]